MHFKTIALSAAFAATTSLAVPALADAPSKDDIAKSLTTIKAQADAVAAGRYGSQAQLQAPARTIAVEWAKIAPTLSVQRQVLVEAKFANASITTFEGNWKSPDKARSTARDVSSNVADLIDATHS